MAVPGLRPFLASALLLSSFAACEGDVLVGEFEPEAGANGGAGGTAGTLSNTTSGGGSAGASECTSRECETGKVYACGNCKDDDGDGAVDSEDPDCLGPCQNDEASYYPNIPGQNGGKCARDCYFDKGAGAGNDRCQWDQHCDALEPDPACPFDPETSVGSSGLSCEEAASSASEACKDTCLPLVPNGCDCFGCCEIEGAPNPVWIGSVVDGMGTCSHETLGDPEKCRPCTPVASCFNLCEECEICVGRSELPASCGDGGETPQTCPGSTAGCGLTGQSDCSVDEYCITGCCILTIK